jgi:hypothetical protein
MEEVKKERFEMIKNDELKQLLLDLNAVDKKRVEIIDLMTEKDKEHNLLLVERQKLIDKMKPIVNVEFIGKLGEFEVLANLDLDTDDAEQIKVKIVDEHQVWLEEKRKSKLPPPVENLVEEVAPVIEA